MNRLFASIMSLAVIAAGCTSAATAPTGSPAPPSIQPPPSRQPATDPTTTPTGSIAAVTPSPAVSVTTVTPSPAAASPLEGIWLAAEVKPDAIEAKLRDAGLQKWIQPFRPSLGDTNGFKVRVTGGQWSLYASRDGGHFENVDFGQYVITGDTVTVKHGDAADVFQWFADGDTLTLSYVSDTMPTTDGIPEEVYQRAFYTSAPFARQP